ncbi:MAG: hypothetical protein ACK4R8_00940 [Thiobacillus sp.]
MLRHHDREGSANVRKGRLRLALLGAPRGLEAASELCGMDGP